MVRADHPPNHPLQPSAGVRCGGVVRVRPPRLSGSAAERDGRVVY